jgi:TolA-binding protein
VRLLLLYALHRAEDFEAARQLVIEEYPRLEQMIQIAAFQTITLELGNHFLENGEARKAMSCLQRIWPQERLVRHQQSRLEKITAARVAAEKRNNNFEVFRLSQLAAKVERELKFFREIENFDAALRLRLATAYLTLQRYHEAALILERMLEDMAPNKVVEEGSVRLVQCWTQVQRWPAVITNADRFLKRFPKSEQRALVLYMKGQAEQNNGDYKDAVATFDQLRLRHPTHELAPRSAFMAGFSFLLAEDYATAAERLEKARKEHAKDEIAESAHFWLGRAKLLDKQYDDGRSVLEDYLTKFKQNGAFIGEATFFKAFGAHAKKDYETGIRELRDFLKNFPGHEQSNEALVLLGDALCAVGDIEEGIAAYKRITPDETRFFEEAQFKIAKALRLSERMTEMRAHLEQFISAHAGSARLPEAIYWIGWSWRQGGQEAKAKELYWQTIAEMGADPARRSMEDVFASVLRLYKTEEERKELLARLRDIAETASDTGETTLRCRALWAQAQAIKKSDAGQSRRLLEEAAKSIEVSSANPMILADCAEALEAAGDVKGAERMMRDLVKWNPRAPQKDRAFAMLGKLALAQGREAEALDWFRRFETESAGSVLTADVLATKARLLEKRGQSAEAIATLEKLLADPYAPGQRKASALIDLGELLLKRGQTQKAFPYFQRVYVMYGRWPEHVAKAYLKSGTILEKLNDPDGARRTYEEMLARDDLASTREAAVARERLARLITGQET